MNHALILPTGWIISPRLMPAWPIDADHVLELVPAERTSDGRIRWRYRLTRKRRVIFSASDIYSSVGAMLSTAELVNAARTVLAFLTLDAGDTDADYFTDYTKAQLAWRDTHAEGLSLFAMDGLCGYCGSEEHPSPGCPAR
ncbi:hypothetical protein ACFSKW_26925 [Nonomuraea mangrovi]|uniref:Uncharacterized protein n=1 Tax=Nonomuraea mangrovi TaxID=2316207 RepID=A0ABW4T0X6_9ACTN